MADVPTPGKAREKLHRRRFRVRVERLQKLIEFEGTPEEIIGKELVLIIQAGMQVYSKDFFFSQLAESMNDLLHLKEGLCSRCIEMGKPNPNLATGVDQMCDRCRKEVDDAFGPGDY